MKKDAPITKKEFQEEMDENMQLIANAFENVATKEDLKQFATKEDLKEYATKKDLQKALEPYATKEEMKEALQQLRKEVKEDTQEALESLYERMESSVLKVQHNHEQRIVAIERQI